MDSGIDNYLHKKFKKQLSIEPKPKQQNDKENKEKQGRPCEAPNQPNGETVPNKSTNQNSTALTPNNPSSIKSSISLENRNARPSNSCISYVVLGQSNEEPVSFDTKFSNETTNCAVSSTSSIMEERLSKPHEDFDSSREDFTKEESDGKNEEPQQSSDRSSGGKYVCTYCNLVCSKPSVLQKHIRAHTNERPYPCISCGFSFKTRSNLYKHCRSRTHANRVMGNKAQEGTHDSDTGKPIDNNREETTSKPYKPRFHSGKQFFDATSKENLEEERSSIHANSDILSHHINEIINKNNCIVNSGDLGLKKRAIESSIENNNYSNRHETNTEEPLNLTNKNRKRSMSEVAEPVVQKSLIKELLLKNLYSDMQCPYCKMIFQTVTELELHKLRSCKGKPSEVKYTRSSSVNVASILTKNKNAFDNIPQLQNTVFPLNSPGPFLGKTRLVESDKSKSFSFDAGNLPLVSSNEISTSNYLLSPLPFEKDKKPPIKLFGGEVKVHSSGGDSRSFRIDNVEDPETRYYGKHSENRVVKSSLQSGGTVLSNFNKSETRTQETPTSKFSYEEKPTEMIVRPEPMVHYPKTPSPSYKYTNMMDFSQNAVRLLTPNIKQPNFPITPTTKLSFGTVPERNPDVDTPKPPPHLLIDPYIDTEPVDGSGVVQKLMTKYPHQINNNFTNPMKLLVNGKVIRYVPGMPGPVQAEEPLEIPFGSNIVAVGKEPVKERVENTEHVNVLTENEFLMPERANRNVLEVKTDLILPQVTDCKSPNGCRDSKSPNNVILTTESKKFARPNSLALKPTTASLKQHHGLTPTLFNKILISPDTPRVAKKFAQHFLHGNYFSYLGLKSSTKPVYCTLNKTQPFYVPHFKKLSMYSEWRQQDTRNDKLYVGAYDSRQRNQRYTTAGKTVADLTIHSSYKFMVSEISSCKSERNDEQKTGALEGGYECTDDYTYIRGRGRGRYVCDQCGIRCKKPSMLKKHIRTHSNDRPYTCSHCNFSFKTKGNLTKHMKSKAHTKNSAASSGSGSSTQLSGTQSSDSDDSGMDSSDESTTRQQEHEAAYGLLSLSQKTTQSGTSDVIMRTGSPIQANENFMTSEEIAFVSKTNYAKNKFLDERSSISFSGAKNFEPNTVSEDVEDRPKNGQTVTNYLGKSSIIRPLTYPYTTVFNEKERIPPVQETPQSPIKPDETFENAKSEPKSIKQFHVIQKYAVSQTQRSPSPKIIDPKAQKLTETFDQNAIYNKPSQFPPNRVPTLKLNDVVLVQDTQTERKRKISVIENNFKPKVQKNDEVMDLSMTSVAEKNFHSNGLLMTEENRSKIANEPQRRFNKSSQRFDHVNEESYGKMEEMNYKNNRESLRASNNGAVDNSAMETLADIATKQVKLEKNTLAKSVATEFLKLATKNEQYDVGRRETNVFAPITKDVNELIVKPEGNKSCTICSKSFSKPSQLRLHMNIHYLERPFRCDSCSVSFRTKGHLQKHERSASHHSKLSTSPAQSSSEPRPFKCSDCNIAFRIHGHLAKHLRSKMHIMKLECLAKIPFGLYAELERSNSLLTEINTSDGDQCLESLKTLAKKVFLNEPNKLQSMINHVDVNS